MPSDTGSAVMKSLLLWSTGNRRQPKKGNAEGHPMMVRVPRALPVANAVRWRQTTLIIGLPHVPARPEHAQD